MTAFVVLLRRELRARRGLFAASLAMGALVALLPLVSRPQPGTAEELRGAASTGLAALWTAALAIGLGTSCHARSFGPRRLGFDLRLPASIAAIWGARWLGAYLTVLACGALVLVVPLIFGSDLAGGAAALDLFAASRLTPTPEPSALGGLLAAAPLLLAFLLLAAGGLEVIVSGRRSLAALDLLALFAAGTGIWIALQELRPWFAYAGQRRVLLLATVVSVAGLLVASARQVAAGRSDQARAHRAFAKAWAFTALLVTGGSVLQARAYVRPGFAELGDVVHLAHGWTASSGRARGRPERHLRFTILSNEITNRRHRLALEPAWGARRERPQVSADQSRIAWLGWDRDAGVSGAAQLWILDAESPEARPAKSAIQWTRPPSTWALSPDGKRVAWNSEARDARVRLGELDGAGYELQVELSDCPVVGSLRFFAADRLEIECLPTARLRGELATTLVVELAPCPRAGRSPACASGRAPRSSW
jgi:hypothetical protein